MSILRWPDQSGQNEIYVQPYPDTTPRWKVSTAGGRDPIWARDGKELFFMAKDGRLMGVQVQADARTWTATSPVKVLDAGYWSSPVLLGRGYDVARDGRFLVVTPPRENVVPPDIVVVQHWDEELRTLVPSK